MRNHNNPLLRGVVELLDALTAAGKNGMFGVKVLLACWGGLVGEDLIDKREINGAEFFIFPEGVELRACVTGFARCFYALGEKSSYFGTTMYWPLLPTLVRSICRNGHASLNEPAKRL